MKAISKIFIFTSSVICSPGRQQSTISSNTIIAVIKSAIHSFPGLLLNTVFYCAVVYSCTASAFRKPKQKQAIGILPVVMASPQCVKAHNGATAKMIGVITTTSTEMGSRRIGSYSQIGVTTVNKRLKLGSKESCRNRAFMC